MDLRSHDFAGRHALGVETFLCHSLADDIAVGHHSDQPVVFANRNGTNVSFTHQLCDFYDRSFRADPVDALMHRIFDLHSGPPISGLDLRSPLSQRYYTTIVMRGTPPRRG